MQLLFVLSRGCAEAIVCVLIGSTQKLKAQAEQDQMCVKKKKKRLEEMPSEAVSRISKDVWRLETLLFLHQGAR